MKLGIIGGSGLYDIDGLENVEAMAVDTPFGPPSDNYIHGTLGDNEAFFLPRHGVGHRLLPSEIKHKANMFGFKKFGVDHVLSVSAVGSLREDYRPRDIVLPDQYFDRTKRPHSDHTFFGEGIVAHVTFGDPICSALQAVLADTAEKARVATGSEIKVHVGGTYVNMEGPAFSTKAESNTYRKLGFDIIGMTSLAEAKLCREAEICYACMAMVTDYDCWHEEEEAVSVEMVLENLRANSNLAKNVVTNLIRDISDSGPCACHSALATALFTPPDAIPADVKTALGPIIGKYVGT